MATIEELQGVVAGLASVVKDLTTNVSQVTQTVGQMAEAAPTASHHDKNQGLCMPSMQLPSFRRDSVIQDDISKIFGAINPANIASSRRNTLVASGTTMCWRLAKVGVVNRQKYRGLRRKSGRGQT